MITTVGGGTMRLLRTRELPERALSIVDAMGLSAVTVTGAQAALEPGARPWRSCCPPY
ncbi:hypothetical protein AB0D38_15160 [Streptomyces sp. NPDC048279]|uniref:hypothetical protein n=1 Tax=Streptomyces sp. NPDC048279 TaxID=3154714 RepID=UPI003421EC8B